MSNIWLFILGIIASSGLSAQNGTSSLEEKRVYPEHPVVLKHEKQVFRGLEGEWVGYIISAEHGTYLPRQPLHWFFQYHTFQSNPDDKSGESLWGVGLFPPGGDRFWVIPVYGTEEMLESLDDDVVEVVYESEGHQYILFMDRVIDELPPPYEGFRPGDALSLKARADQIRREMNDTVMAKEEKTEIEKEKEQLKRSPEVTPLELEQSNTAQNKENYLTAQSELEAELREIEFCRQWIIDYNHTRETFHHLCRQWWAHPPEECLNDMECTALFRTELIKE